MTYGAASRQYDPRAEAEWEYRRRTHPPQAAPSLAGFVGEVHPRYQWYKHCETLGEALEGVVDGSIKRLMVFMPPRHGKSELISRLFSAYYLLRHPDRWVGLTSYAADLAYTFSRAARDHYTRAGGTIRGDAGAVKHWETPAGGGMWAAGVGGPITGKGFHLGIIDDPLKNAEEASSAVIREKQREWYESTFYTRAEPGAAIIVVQTRWHEEDLSGYLLSSEDDEPEHWHIVNLPAIADDAPLEFPPTCTVVEDWREIGQALCPERYPLARLEQIAGRIGTYFFSSLFQQRPQPRQGNYFKRGWFEIVSALPVGLSYVRYWDLAGGVSDKADYTAGVLMGRSSDGYFYVCDVQHGRWAASERNSVIKQTAVLDKQRYGSVQTYIEQAPGLSKEPTEDLVRQLAGFSVYADRVSKDKVSRAEPFQAQAQAGNVKLMNADWNGAWLDELASFPTGAHDDLVDASSGAFNHLSEYGAGFALPYDERAKSRRRGW